MAIDRSWRRIAFIILGIGALIVAGGLALGYGSLRLVLYGEREPGEVVEVVREGDMYAPVVRFRLPNGERHEVKDLGVGAPDFAVGDQVTVLYWPHDPSDFRIATFDRLWFSTIFLCVFGGFWLLFGLVAWASPAASIWQCWARVPSPSLRSAVPSSASWRRPTPCPSTRAAGGPKES